MIFEIPFSKFLTAWYYISENGKIDFDEFLLLVKKYERPLPEDIEMREMFKTLDKDRNGYVDAIELKTSFSELGIPLTDEDVQAMMKEAGVKTDRIYYKGSFRNDHQN